MQEAKAQEEALTAEASEHSRQAAQAQQALAHSQAQLAHVEQVDAKSLTTSSFIHTETGAPPAMLHLPD